MCSTGYCESCQLELSVVTLEGGGRKAAVIVKQEPCGFYPSQPPEGLVKLRLSRTSLLAQCISPGLVETQFAFKLHDKDPEQAAATYEQIKVGPPSGPDKATWSLSTLGLYPLPSLSLLEGWGRNMGVRVP